MRKVHSRTDTEAKRKAEKRTNHSPEELQNAYRVALLVEKGWSQEKIAQELGVARGTVVKWWNIALDAGIYVSGVIPPIGVNILDDLRQKMLAEFNLKDVVLVKGRKEMLKDALHSATKEAIFHSATRAAAEYLDRKIIGSDVLCLAWGRVVHAVIQSLHPTKRLPNLTIVPLLGVLSVQPDWFEANALVQAMAEAYHSKDYYCLPIPAIVRDAQQKRIAEQLPLVTDVLDKMKRATFVVTSLAPPDPQRSALVHRRRRHRILEPEEIKRVIQRGAVGEICAWWFNQRGEPVTDERIEPIGLGLNGLQQVVKNRDTVMAIVAADSHRIAPLLAALKGKMVNVVVTDHVTGEELLRRVGR
jgi:DNA-binding transcriptional regulator LsrR (DeoR family)